MAIEKQQRSARQRREQSPPVLLKRKARAGTGERAEGRAGRTEHRAKKLGLGPGHSEQPGEGDGWGLGFHFRKLTLAAVRRMVGEGRLGHGDTGEEAAMIFQLRAEA